MPGPLSGVRIVDATTMISGPLATMILADQGAEVIKLEHPRGGDHSRQVADRRGGFSASFLNNNRGKRSVTLDLKDPRGVEAALKLVRGADVFVQNWRPGVADRIGLGEAALRAVQPDIIYASIAGFGFEGPLAKKPVYDPLIQALSGLATVQGAGGRPRLIRTILPDKATGLTAAQAITAALFARQRTGEGQSITLSMLDAIVFFLWSSDMSGHTFIGDEAAEDGWKSQSFIELIYETADGYMAVSAHTDATWAGLARATGHPEWLEDPRFASVAAREIHKTERLELTQGALLADTTANWMTRLEAEDVPCAPALKRGEMIRHPQIAANGTLIELDHPDAGAIRQAVPAARFGGRALQPGLGHKLGADTEAALAEAGYTAEEIAALIQNGVAPATRGNPMIDFYYAPTPNGWKVAIMLEECGVAYETKLMRLYAGDQFTPEFLAISPNARMPAIVDHDPPSQYGVAPVPVFESGAILLYLAEKTGQFAPTDAVGRKELNEWLFWQVGNQGPMGGQLSHFRNYAPDDQKEYGLKRYAGEYEKTLAVLDNRLDGRDYLLGAYSIADMLAFPWAFIAKPMGASLDTFPNVAAWRGRLKTRPAVQNAINLYKADQNRGQHNASNNKVLFNQDASSLKSGQT